MHQRLLTDRIAVALSVSPTNTHKTMKGFTVLSAALLAVPMCLEAQAADNTALKLADQLLATMDNISAEMEQVTPATADRSAARIQGFIQQLAITMQAASKLTPEQNAVIDNNAAYAAKLEAAQRRMAMAAASMLQRAQVATQEEQAQYLKVLNVLQTIQSIGAM